MQQYKTVKEYLAQPWSFDVEWIEDPYHGENWTVFVKELPGCKTHGKTPAEAIKNISEAIESYVLAVMDVGGIIPEPIQEEHFKGTITYRTQPEKHYRLAKVAQRRGVSLNKLIDTAVDQLLAG